MNYQNLLKLKGEALVLSKGNQIWTSNGPYGGTIQAMTVDSDYVYIGTVANGVYRHPIDQPGSWEARRGNIDLTTVISLLTTAYDTLFTGLENNGLWQTGNGGINWQQNTFIPESSSVNFIYQFKRDTLFTGTEFWGVYRSFNGGFTWNKVGGNSLDTVNARAFTDDTFNLYIGTDNGILVSSDLGNSWIPLYLPGFRVYALDFFNGFLYAGCENGLYYMDTLGFWHSTEITSTVTDFDNISDSVYVSTWGKGVFMGGIGDSLYKQMDSGLLCKIVNNLKVYDGTIFTGTNGGFFVSLDSGYSWFEENQDLDANIMWDIEMNPQNHKSMYTVCFGGLYKSVDNGNSWFRYGLLPENSLFRSIAINPQDSSNIIIGGFFGLYRTNDNGNSWNIFDIGERVVEDIEIDPTNPDVVYSAVSDLLLRSFDNGINWAVIDSGKFYSDIEICNTATETLYVATYYGMYKSNDFGNFLYEINNGLPVEPVSDVEIDGYNTRIIYSGLRSSPGTHLFRSSNGGRNWEPTAFSYGPVADLKTSYGIPYHIFVNTIENNVIFSINRGDDWMDISPSEYSQSISLYFNPDYHTVFMGNISGVHTFTDTNPPYLDMTAGTTFSPDGDFIDDRIRFDINASDTHDIYYWSVSILFDTLIIRSYDGLFTPDSVFWDGYNDNGILEKNGSYRALCTVMDGFLTLDSLSRNFILDKKPMVSGILGATSLSQGRKIAVDNNGRIHLVYSTFIPEEIFYVNSNDGVNWSEPLNLSNSKDEYSINPCINVNNNNNIFVFWEEEYSDSHEIVYQKYENNIWFVKPIALSSSTGKSKNPNAVITPDNNVHLVWEEKDNGEIYYRRYNNLSGIWGSSVNLSLTSGISQDPFLLSHNGLYLFFSDNTNHPDNFDIRYRHYNGSVWLPESLLITTPENSFSSFAVNDTFNKIHFFCIDSTPGNYDIYYKTFMADSGWSADTNITSSSDQSLNPTVSVDELDNIYLFWEENGEIFRKIRDHQSGWLVTENISNSPAVNSQFPSSSYNCDLVWTEGDNNPYDILYNMEKISDDKPPEFTIFILDTCYLGDSLKFDFSSNELLNDIPEVWIKDSDIDSIQFSVINTGTYDYSAETFIYGLTKGTGSIRIRGTDQSNNTTDTTINIPIETRGSLLPFDSCFAFPNPSREDYIKFMFYLNQDSRLKIDIFTISGRKLKTFINKDYEGGRLYEETMDVSDMGSDIYIFRVVATASNEKEIITKKFGIIR